MAERNVSGKGLAGLLDVSHVAVGRWTNGKNKPTYQNCVKIAEFFDIPEDNILILAGYREPMIIGHDTNHLPIRQPTHVAEPPAAYHTSTRTRLDDLLDTLTNDQLESLITFLESLHPIKAQQ